MLIKPEIKATLDGSQTLIHPVLGELYHSDKGAVGEALHVYIANGLEQINSQSVNILEIGFGSGLNAYLSAQRASNKRKINYFAVELYPISLDTAKSLDYSKDELFMSLHTASWEEKVEITEDFSLTKWAEDLLKKDFFDKFDLVYFDAFAPDSCPELWSCEVFKKLADSMTSGAILVTYCAKGIVKQALRDAGFTVKRLQGALGKHHMIRATKQ